jgi:hypothetical protein
MTAPEALKKFIRIHSNFGSFNELISKYKPDVILRDIIYPAMEVYAQDKSGQKVEWYIVGKIESSKARKKYLHGWQMEDERNKEIEKLILELNKLKL